MQKEIIDPILRKHLADFYSNIQVIDPENLNASDILDKLQLNPDGGISLTIRPNNSPTIPETIDRAIERTTQFLLKCPDIEISDTTEPLITFAMEAATSQQKCRQTGSEFIPADESDNLIEKLRSQFSPDTLTEAELEVFRYIEQAIRDRAFKPLSRLLRDILIQEERELKDEFSRRCRDTAKPLQPLFAFYYEYRTKTASYNDDQLLPIESIPLLRKILDDTKDEDGVLYSIMPTRGPKPCNMDKPRKVPPKKTKSGKLRQSENRIEFSLREKNLYDLVEYIASIREDKALSLNSTDHGTALHKSIISYALSVYTMELHGIYVGSFDDSERQGRLVALTRKYIKSVYWDLVTIHFGLPPTERENYASVREFMNKYIPDFDDEWPP